MIRRLRRIGSVALAAVALSAVGCGAPVVGSRDPLVAAREAALHSDSGETIARWLLFELVAPGGSVPRAREARTRIDQVAREDRGLYPSVARGIDDEAHGELDSAARAYLDAVDAARDYAGPEASLLAWFATSRLLTLRTSVADLWPSAKQIVERAIREPGHIGFRARGDLIDWWSFDTKKEGKLTAAAVDTEAARLLGCVREVSLAGPFGGPGPLDIVTSFDAERPGPWPLEFEKNARRSAPPRKLAVDAHPSCSIGPKAQSGAGVHYLETYLELDHEADVLVAVQNAWAVLVDDVPVLERDPREFGSWPRFGVAIRLSKGRHRLVARLGSGQTTVRVLDLDGRPARVRASADGSLSYSLERPVVLPDPNALAPFLEASGVRGQIAWPKRPAHFLRVDASDPVLGFLAAQLVHVEGQDDLASVLLEPLVKEAARTPPLTMAVQADLIESDPIFAEGDARDLALDLRTRAVEIDARLWFPRLWLSLDAAQKQGPKDQLPVLAALALEFRKVPAATKALGALYARLGYKPEHQRTVLEAAQRFPDDPEVLRSLLAVHDEAGDFEKADLTAEKLARIEPTAQIGVERALVRGDYARAIELLEADAKQADAEPSSAERARFDRRVQDLLIRAGQQKEAQDALERALTEDPTSEQLNLSLADARFAGGDHAALRKALAHAIETGADTDEVRAALEVVDGVSELEAYRLDARQVIAAFEKSGAAKAGLDKTGSTGTVNGGGNAARVLDYAAIRVHDDGSARMLEHEILHIKSREAIAQLAEQRLPRGRLLKLRTIKADGRTFEPEIVQGKPTATMPHLELGDYIETETLYDLPSDGAGGRAFVAPRWFFREEKIDYDRSEFIVITPKARKLDIETTGSVPEPSIRDLGAYVERRWRVDESPALPEEPASAPITEFLPSVRVGWGVSQQDTLARLLDASTNLAPRDPRLVRIAKTIVSAGTKLENQEEALAGLGSEEKARRLYRWVLDNVEQGREDDPRRTVIGKSGSRMEAFLYLCRLVGVEARHAVVKDRLMPPPRGPISEAEQYTRLAAIIPTSSTPGDKNAGELWTIVDDKYAPFGYLPGSMRGQPAVVLTKGLPRTTTGTRGTPDGVTHHGHVDLAADGSAKISLEQRYEGRIAIELREAIQTLPEDRLKDAIESQLLPQAIPGARLVSLEVTGLTDLDAPLVLSMKIEASTFARRSGAELILSPPFRVSFRPLAALEKRETPLLLNGPVAMRIAVDLTVRLPKGASVETELQAKSGVDGGRSFAVKDRTKGTDLVLERIVEIQPGRIQPEDYPAFVAFARAVDEAIQRDLVVKLP